MNRTPWVENLFRPLAVGVMSGCIALSLVGLVRLFAPTWNGTYLVAGGVLAALEANYSYQLIRARQLRGTDVLRFRAFEIATFFILLKIGSYAGDRWADVLADVKTWPRQPFNIVGPETTVAFILALLSWQASTQTARDLEQIGEPPERHRHYVPPMEKLTGRFFWGGTALLVVAGITRIGIAALLDLSRPSVPGLVLNVLVYFLLGLVMLGQVQFTRLRTQWQAQRIKITDELASRWVRYSLALIGLAALVAFVLPTGYTVGLLDDHIRPLNHRHAARHNSLVPPRPPVGAACHAVWHRALQAPARAPPARAAPAAARRPWNCHPWLVRDTAIAAVLGGHAGDDFLRDPQLPARPA
jgi:hypothetical protein